MNNNTLQTKKFSLFDAQHRSQTNIIRCYEREKKDTRLVSVRSSLLCQTRSKTLVSIMGPSLRNISYSCDSHCSARHCLSARECHSIVKPGMASESDRATLSFEETPTPSRAATEKVVRIRNYLLILVTFQWVKSVDQPRSIHPQISVDCLPNGLYYCHSFAKKQMRVHHGWNR